MLKLSDLRKRRREDDDLWPITLADMMTLLLCFFLLIVAVSHVDENRYERVADSMQKALVPESTAQKPKPAPPKPQPAQPAKPAQPEPDGVRSKVSRTTLAREPGPTPEPDKAAAEEEKAKTPAETAEAAERTGPKRKTLDDIRTELAAKLSKNVSDVELIPRDFGVALNLKGAAFFDRSFCGGQTAG